MRKSLLQASIIPLPFCLLSVEAGAVRSIERGVAEGRCRPDESGPALVVAVEGLKDRQGALKIEVYPSNDHDFLEDDKKLIAEGKAFRRTVAPVPDHGTPRLCVRVPDAGTYAVTIHHDRNENRKFDLSKDGVAFVGNPKLGLSKPRASEASISVGNGIARTSVVMNYRKGLLSFGPVTR